MTDNTRTEAREFTMSQYASKDDMIGAMRKRIAELESELEAVGAGGVQALSAAPAGFVPVAAFDRLHAHAESLAARLLAATPTPPALSAAPAIGDELRDTLVAVSAAIAERDDRAAQKMIREILAASPTPPAEQQAAPKAAPLVGNSDFDHKTAADLLNNKTVSDEAVRKFVATSRWAHDERAALSATLLAMHGVLTSREAEIALLKKALLEAETAPQQEAQEPCPTCVALARTVMLDQVSFDRKPDCYGIRQITDDEGVEEWEDIRTSPDVAREEANDMMATGRGEIYEVVPLWTTPQPAPAPLSESIDQVERALAIIGVVGAIDGHDVVRRESVLEIARRAAIAAQGGK